MFYLTIATCFDVLGFAVTLDRFENLLAQLLEIEASFNFGIQNLDAILRGRRQSPLILSVSKLSLDQPEDHRRIISSRPMYLLPLYDTCNQSAPRDTVGTLLL